MPRADDAVFAGLGRIAFLDRDDVAAGLVVEFDHVLQAAAARHGDHVGQEQREGLFADEFARAPYGMAEAQRLLLPGKAGLTGQRLQALQLRQLVVFAALRQRVVQFELNVEMVFDDRLVAAGHEDEMLYAGFPRLVDDVLDDRSVDDRQHFFRDRLGGGEETRAETGDWKDCFADFFHAVNYPFLRSPGRIMAGHFHHVRTFSCRNRRLPGTGDTSALPVRVPTAFSFHATDMVN